MKSELYSHSAIDRNKAAIFHIDNPTGSSLEKLASALEMHKHSGQTGTLIYAMGHFDCSSKLELLVTSALVGSYEATSEVMYIFGKLKIQKSDPQVRRIREILVDNKLKKLSAHNKEALEEFNEIFSEENL